MAKMELVCKYRKESWRVSNTTTPGQLLIEFSRVLSQNDRFLHKRGFLFSDLGKLTLTRS